MSHYSGHWLGHDLRALTFQQVMSSRAETFGDKIFLTFLDDGRTWTYRDADIASDRIAGALLAKGIRHGSHVGIMLETCPENLLLQLALGKIGAVGVLVNTAARGDQLRHFLALGGCVMLVADAQWLDHIDEIVGSLTDLEQVIVLGRPATSADERGRPSRSSYEELVHGPAGLAPQPVRFSDMAHIIFTSGTTGPSKGVAYTQARSLMFALDTILTLGMRQDDVLHCWMPLFHLSGLQSGTLTALMAGASIVMTRRFTASGLFDQLRASGATIAYLVGATINMLWAQPPTDRDRDHRLRVGWTVPMPSFAIPFQARFGVQLVSAYGLTDCGMPTAFNASDPESKLGSAGRPRDGWHVRVVDPDDFDMPVGASGEIVMRCERPWGSATGYHDDAEATVAAWRNGWFHTGDTGYLDEDGYLWYVGRTKDSIRRRGENISAYEVEQAIQRHPAVAEAAAFPLPSELGEDEVAVAIVRKDGEKVSEADIIEHSRSCMARHMVPRFVQFVDDLPRNLSQKVQKARLIETGGRDRSLLWDSRNIVL